MKTPRYLVLLVLAALFLTGVSPVPADEDYRVFTDADGREVNGYPVKFRVAEQVVTIKRADGKVYNVPLEVFSESDRNYIKDWALQNALVIEAVLRDFGPPRELPGSRYEPEYVKCLGYEISLANRSGIEIESIKIEYCLFYRQVFHEQKRRRVAYEGIQCGGTTIDVLPAGSIKKVRSEAVLLYDQSAGQKVTLLGSEAKATGNIQGIWLTLTGALSSGETISRKLCVPRDLCTRKEWTTTSVLVGLNAELAKQRMARPKLPPREHKVGYYTRGTD